MPTTEEPLVELHQPEVPEEAEINEDDLLSPAEQLAVQIAEWRQELRTLHIQHDTHWVVITQAVGHLKAIDRRILDLEDHIADADDLRRQAMAADRTTRRRHR